MIRFENLSKSFWVRGHRKVVFSDLNLTLPTGRSLALLGRNGAGKSTLLQIIAGTLHADTGRVVTDGSISWPVGFGGSLNPQMTGIQNTRFVARAYGVDTESLLEFIRDFTELGPQLDAPVRTYSAGMKGRLGFGMSMGIHFDTYLIDETTAVGDAAFNRKSKAVFRARMQNASAIMVSHQMETLRDFCDAGILLSDGQIQYFDDLEEAIAAHLEKLA